MPKTEVDEFFDGLNETDNKVADIFEEPKEPEIKEEETPEKPRKNREHRRLEKRLDEKDEMLNALNERVIELSKDKQTSFHSSEMPPEWIALYGTTPEAEKAWKVQESLLKSVKESATTDALERFRNEQQEERQEQKKFESFIDAELESLEDTFDTDLTSNAPAARKARREFLELVEKLSPKDEEGNVTGYADFESAFEIYKANQSKEKSPEVVSRQKELSTRSMQKPGNADSVPPKRTPGFFGWAKDLKINS